MRTIKKVIYLVALAATTLCISCNNNQSNDTQSFVTKTELRSCNTDTSIYYTIYTPQINQDTKYPIIIFLDPHKQGQIPVEKYAQLASKYKYMLMGSNNLHNGMPASRTEYIINSLVNEACTQYPIDTNRIYLCGFSGGAKVAMMNGLHNKAIRGVVACGGSITPSVKPDSTFCFVGMVGNQDFNYLDMQQALAAFQRNNVSFTSVIFDGKHEWPMANDFENAFKAFQINAMRYGLTKTNVDWLKSEYTALSDSIYRCLDKAEYMKASELIARIQSWYVTVVNDVKIITAISKLNNSQTFQTQLAHLQTLTLKEISLRGQFINSIETRDFDWWKTEVENFNKSINSTDQFVCLTSKRLLAYLSMMSFALANNDIANKNAEKAFNKIKIYELVDPENPDVYLMYAQYYLLVGDKTKMEQSYNKALEKGFNSYAEYASDPTWKWLFAQPEIKNY